MDDKELMMQASLIAWGVQKLGEWLKEGSVARQLCPTPINALDLSAYERVLWGTQDRKSRLLAPLSVVYDPEEETTPQPPGKLLQPTILQFEDKETAVT